jgi:thiosulfate dehydrogenase [quinone] large subunit
MATAATHHGAWAADHGGVLTAEHVATYSFVGIRLLLAFEFLWAFGDKTFGWGVATPAERAWVNGGSPTEGYLSGVEGTFAGFFGSLAGNVVIDWLFMLGLLGIGLALALGIGMRVAAAAGALLMLLMWLASMPIGVNPFVDNHLVYAILLIALAAVAAGDTLGFGRWWAGRGIVKRYPALR